MITYTAAYIFEDDTCIGEVLDFPGTVSCGKTLDETRKHLSDALLDMAETNLMLGDPLPKPQTSVKDGADIIEPIYLVLQASHQLDITPHTSVPT